ncbi:uncharacterized protein A1O9_03749 [Exophiala aquamarina CBS 119918]|uniref:ferric-chelate reductase (NADPH) n=1 Tax=Exophiala aquamarina CBS 119918 TaxID=1182545 RepID=A0A072PGC3_9EURO|nr:uncharacterized protein A1O9_03749 [Exophiala aquamarina CBS 119918]KEF58906.1 hypothetical protein A1O9_03749 [Exophiala aquamarina CBS 119918]
MALMWTNVIFRSHSDLYKIKLEVVAFRAGWVSTVQLPLLYATAIKVSPITYLTGISYERINWLHRWIARFMVMTLFLHAFFFVYEWGLTKSIVRQLQILPMALWGFAAWGTMILMVFTGWRYIRFRFYETWVVSHILGAYAALALTYIHTRCTTYFVLASLILLSFDIVGRTLLWMRNNAWYPLTSKSQSKLGHVGHLQALDNEYLELELRNTSLRWRPGQHVMLQAPGISLLQSHPFTISNIQDDQRSAVFIIKRHKGFTDRLWQQNAEAAAPSLQVFVSGPFGNPPCLSTNGIIVFISTGNRASYTYALLLGLLSNQNAVHTIRFHHIIRNRRMLLLYRDHIDHVTRLGSCAGVDVSFIFQVTSVRDREVYTSDTEENQTLFDVGTSSSTNPSRRQSIELSAVSDRSSPVPFIPEKADLEVDKAHLRQGQTYLEPEQVEMEEAGLLTAEKDDVPDEGPMDIRSESVHFSYSQGRQPVDVMLRPTIANASGDVAVVAAVPSPLAAEISQAVSRMSHKLAVGSGKSTIRSLRLWLESYG